MEGAPLQPRALPPAYCTDQHTRTARSTGHSNKVHRTTKQRPSSGVGPRCAPNASTTGSRCTCAPTAPNIHTLRHASPHESRPSPRLCPHPLHTNLLSTSSPHAHADTNTITQLNTHRTHDSPGCSRVWGGRGGALGANTLPCSPSRARFSLTRRDRVTAPRSPRRPRMTHTSIRTSCHGATRARGGEPISRGMWKVWWRCAAECP